MVFDFLKLYCIIVDFIHKFLENPSNLPSFLHTIGIALLTILIPISIAMFSGDKKFIGLDKNVILDKIFRPKRFLSVLGLIFIPILFWHISTFEFKIIELILWIIGISMMINILNNSYFWIKGNRYNYRFDYLNNLKVDKDLVESMRSVWEEGDMDIKSEIEFLRIFAVKVDQKIKINYEITFKLLNDFRIYLNNPIIYPFPIALLECIFPKILAWHYLVWELKENHKYKTGKIGSPTSLINYFKAKNTLYFIFLEFEKLALKDNLALESYFRSLTAHIEGLLEKDDDAHKNILEYFKYFFETFYSGFFPELSNIPEINEMWNHYFPREWKIITENYAKDSLSSYSFKNFCNWAKERIRQAEDDTDNNLDEAASELFPEVDHGIWAIILIFILLPVPEEKNRTDNVIKHPWNFGKVGVYIGKSIEERLDNTFKLAKLLFKEQLSKKNLENYINILSKLSTKYQKDATYENKIQELLMVFKKMLKK